MNKTYTVTINNLANKLIKKRKNKMKLDKELENVSTKTILKLKFKELFANVILSIVVFGGLFLLLILVTLIFGK